MNLVSRPSRLRRKLAAATVSLAAIASGLTGIRAIAADAPILEVAPSVASRVAFPEPPSSSKPPSKPQFRLQKNEDELNELLVLGREQVDEEDYAGAIDTYRQAAQLDDTNPLIFSAIGYLESLQDNYPAAIEAYQQAIALDDSEARFHYALGYALAQDGQYAEAEAAYQDTLDLEADNINALLGLGATRFRQERYAEALEAYERAGELSPNSLNIDGFIGSTLLQLGRFEEAIENFERVTTRTPNDLNAQINLGTALLNVGRDEEAFEAFDRAERLNSDDGQLLYDLGQLLGERGDTERAKRYYRRASNLDNDGALQLDIGRALLDADDSLYAVLALRAAIGLIPDEPEAHIALSEALRAQSRTDEAIAELEQARDLYDARGNAEKVEELTAAIADLDSL